jgi:hypothetical protein
MPPTLHPDYLHHNELTVNARQRYMPFCHMGV